METGQYQNSFMSNDVKRLDPKQFWNR